MNQDPSTTKLNERTSRFISFILVAAMLTCGTFTLFSLFERLFPDWQPFYLAGLVFFTAFERFYTYRRYNRLALFSPEWFAAVGSEWIVILLLVKAVVSISHGLGAFQAEIQGWQQDFTGSFFSFEFVFAVGVVLTAWSLAGKFAELIDEMSLEQILIRQSAPEMYAGEFPPRVRLLHLFINLGSCLVFFTALVRVDMRAFIANTGNLVFIRVPALEGGGASTLLYFMLGLVLLGQAQLMDLQSRWAALKIPVQAGITRRWAFYSLCFFGILASLVAILPTSYSLGLLDLIGRALAFLTGVLFFIGHGLLTILMLLLSLPFMLFGKEAPVRTAPFNLPKITPPPQNVPTDAGGASWFEIAKTIILWLGLILLLAFSIRQYLRQHEEVFLALRKAAARFRLAGAWQWLLTFFGTFKKSVEKIAGFPARRSRAAASISTATGSGFFSSLRRLDSRQKIHFFYFAFLRRGGESGLARRSSQTPHEYAASLDASLPAVMPEIDSLTRAFVEARYSSHPVEPEKVNLVKQYWARIRKAFQGKTSKF